MYSLQDLDRIYRCKHHLNLERFVHYFTHRFGYSEIQAREGYKIFQEFPVYDPRQHDALNQILPKAIQVVEEMLAAWDKRPDNLIAKPEKIIYKLIYRDKDIKEAILNLGNTDDIITYADILKRDVELVAFLKLVDTFYHKGADQHAFDGDFYDSYDKFWGDKSNVYLACAKEKCFKRLIYIKGKGYLLNQQPNIDPDGRYNSHALTMNKFTKLGNIFTDLEKLQA